VNCTIPEFLLCDILANATLECGGGRDKRNVSFKSDHVKFGGMFCTKTRLEGGEDWGFGVLVGWRFGVIELLIFSLFDVWVGFGVLGDDDDDDDVDIDQSSI